MELKQAEQTVADLSPIPEGKVTEIEGVGYNAATEGSKGQKDRSGEGMQSSMQK